MDRSINNKHSQDLCIYLLRHYEVLIKTFQIAAENGPIMLYLGTINHYQKREIHLKTLTS